MPDARIDAELSLNRAVARILMELSCDGVLEAIHETRILSAICLNEGDIEVAEQADAVSDDLDALYEVLLTFDSDPEIIKRNWTAMLFTALSPFIVSIEEYVTGEDRPLWQFGVSSSVIFTEALGAFQYISSVQINADVHYRSRLLMMRERAYQLSLRRARTPEEVHENADAVRDFFDNIRSMKIPPTDKAPLLVVLHLVLFLAGYRILRSSFTDAP